MQHLQSGERYTKRSLTEKISYLFNVHDFPLVQGFMRQTKFSENLQWRNTAHFGANVCSCFMIGWYSTNPSNHRTTKIKYTSCMCHLKSTKLFYRCHVTRSRFFHSNKWINKDHKVVNRFYKGMFTRGSIWIHFLVKISSFKRSPLFSLLSKRM